MSESLHAPDPPELAEDVFEALAHKATLPLASMIVLGLLAGVYIGLGGMFATVALAGAEGWPFGAAQVIAGLVFSLGLALVMIAGAELFTGNTLMIGPVCFGRLALSKVASALGVVYLANFAGALLLALVITWAGVHEAGDGAVGRAAIELAQVKSEKAFLQSLASGIVANLLVCLAVWLSYAGRTVSEKFIGLLLPIAAFVAAGLEHSVANMYLLPYGSLVEASSPELSASLSLSGVASNLVAATIGNILGGALLALSYAYVYTARS